MADEKHKFSIPAQEEKILKFWEDNNTFKQSLAKNKKGQTFVFYEGPPTANGLPHVGHALTRSFKDVVLRYKTMRGFFVPRRAGWDTHGLPVEIEVEKQLGLKSKHDIEKYGIAKFNKQAKESVWKYKDEWEKLTKRLGFWLDMEHPYVTYHTPYIETLWWIIKEAWKKKLLYQDFKVVPWCSRCETGLSSHEVGLGYKKVKEDSIFVKLKLKKRQNEFLLVWTTTPWTLPANVAVAINPKLEYTKFKITTHDTRNMTHEYIWSARTPPFGKDQGAVVVEKVAGKTLLDMEYEPLFSVPDEYSLGEDPPYKTIAGNFVSLDEGTGMVHLAPAFGEDDMRAVKDMYGTRYPILHTVNPDGTMKKGVVGEGMFAKEADGAVTNALNKKGLLYQVATYEHDYPFCWRCSTPLLYFAKTAWWVRMNKLRGELIRQNKQINWIPDYIKEGRFGEFLREVRDWAFSRERYWGTPLPTWECEGCKYQEVIGSREELDQLSKKSSNRYLLMRHGEALSNVKRVVAYDPKDTVYRETLRGLKQAEQAGKKLVKKKVDLIFSSDILRTRQTAEIVSRILGIEKVHFDKRLREVNSGLSQGENPKAYHRYFVSTYEKFTRSYPGGETLTDLRKRIMDFMREVEKKYSDKTILVVSHDYPLWMLYSGSLGLSNEEAVELLTGRDDNFFRLSEVKSLVYRNIPRDENYEVDLHRPYVDDFPLSCPRCSSSMKRVPEVVDVWFDSGGMPYASAHYPFTLAKSTNSKAQIPKQKEEFLYPADFIVEAVDQTRGWFYTLLAVSTLLGKGRPYKNVISLGHVLDKNGQKMSKSKGNVVDPGEMIQKYGADSLRWYFYTVNPPGEPKRFDEKDLFNRLRGFLMTFWNSFVLFDTYVDKFKIQNSKFKSLNVLDRWVLIRLEQMVREVTKKLDTYDVTSAARVIEDFTINDFSQWYLRRSRRRLQHPSSEKEKSEVAATSAFVLVTLCKISAPFVPFLGETIYQELRKKLKLKETSVHLADWPATPRIVAALENMFTAKEKKKAAELIDGMAEVRMVVAEALKLRAQAGIKVRQPLRKLKVKSFKFKVNDGLVALIKEEVNVKEVIFGGELELDTTITQELKEEGMVREFIRNIQEMRRDLGLKPRQVIVCQISGDHGIESVLEKWAKQIKEEINSKEFKVGGKKIFKVERDLELDRKELWVGIS